MGTATFKAAYGTNRTKANAFGKCVSHRTAQNTADQGSAQQSAEQQCRAQQNADPAAFKDKYGTNHNEANAFGICVSQTARSISANAETTQVTDEDNAANECRSERRQDPAAFKDKYGTNHNKANAFGKCVSEKARMQEQRRGGS
jgi:hypothetical protein